MTKCNLRRKLMTTCTHFKNAVRHMVGVFTNSLFFPFFLKEKLKSCQFQTETDRFNDTFFYFFGLH